MYCEIIQKTFWLVGIGNIGLLILAYTYKICIPSIYVFVTVKSLPIYKHQLLFIENKSINFKYMYTKNFRTNV